MSNMVVRTNIFALNAHRNMKNVGLEQGRASNRLSSGFRINSAADDAAGLAISETMRAQIRGLDQASRNAQDGQAMILTTEGGLEEIGNMLQRVRELLVQASNDTNTQDQRTMIEQEINQLAQEIGSMQQRVEFNTNRVLAMGPAMSSDINNAVADIEADGIRVSDAFALLDANRQAVADAREMLAALSGTMTFDELNSRQQALVNNALAAVNLSEVTGGVVTTVNTNIPADIMAVNTTDLTPVAGVSATLAAGIAAWNALDAMITERAAAAADVSAAESANGGAGDAALLAAANARLAAADAAIEAAGFDNVDAVTAARDALLDIDPATARNADGTFDLADLSGATGTLSDYAAALIDLNQVNDDLATATMERDRLQGLLDAAIAAGADGAAALAATEHDGVDFSSWDASTAAIVGGAGFEDLTLQAALTQWNNFVTAIGLEIATEYQVAYDDAVAALNDQLGAWSDAGFTVTGSTVTALIGAMNDRDSALADRTSTLNQVRADMLSAAEVQFSEIAAFANANTSGDFVAFFQVGANANQGITFDFETVSRAVSSAAAVANMASILVANPGTGSGIGRGIEVSPVINQIQASLDDVNSIRANMGAVQNRMDFTMRSLDISSENLQDSESRVRNADVAREMMRFTMANVLQQAAVSMLSQANQLPNNLLQLLR